MFRDVFHMVYISSMVSNKLRISYSDSGIVVISLPPFRESDRNTARDLLMMGKIRDTKKQAIRAKRALNKKDSSVERFRNNEVWAAPIILNIRKIHLSQSRKRKQNLHS